MLAVAVMMIAGTAQAQRAQSSLPVEFNFFRAQANASRAAFRLMPAGAFSNTAYSRFSLSSANPAVGSGSAGRIAKWSGVIGTNTFTLGNSSITEDKFGKVGIGTTSPTSPLTVVGMIETINPAGGIKFPDGTIQTTSANGALFSVVHDATLAGNGAAASPLGVAVPLNLIGAVPNASLAEISNSGDSGIGVKVKGGDSIGGGGSGVEAFGGKGNLSGGGTGVAAIGGDSADSGGHGVVALGGKGNGGTGGIGVIAFGGKGEVRNGGVGIHVSGGDSTDGSGGAGIVARGGSGLLGGGLAGSFVGDVEVTGMLSKAGGSFRIDHPLDPENRYLSHSFVESPDMKNIYDGNVVTDGNGDAIVELPAYFEALNRDFCYQLTVIGSFAQAIVAQEIKGNRFSIRTNAPNVKVSWQVTGIRQDAWANRNRIKVEENKSERERGHYLHPEAFDQPEGKSVERARDANEHHRIRMEQMRRQPR